MQTPQIPNVPMIDDEGKLTDVWRRWFADFFEQFQINLNEEGFRIPIAPSVNVDQYIGQNYVGNIVYDSDRGAFVANVNGSLYTVNLTAV